MKFTLLLLIGLFGWIPTLCRTSLPVPTVVMRELSSEKINQCGSCEGECQTYGGGRCKCDADCEAFGDCCGPQRSNACEGVTLDLHLEGLQFTCQSIYVDSEIDVVENEAFWMVSSCPADWLDETGQSGQMVLEGCNSEARDLPPVTDTITGIVYKNQHCALCHRVENAAPWEANIVCTPYLYQLLQSTPISEIDANLFQEQCRPCSYLPQASSVRPPRACYPTVNTCLDRTRPHYTIEEYEVLVNECVNGSYDPKKTFLVGSSVMYHNSLCALCNELLVNLECSAERGLNTVPYQCIPSVIPPPTNSTPLDNSSNGSDNNYTIVDYDGRPTDRINQGIPFTISLSNLG